MSIRCPHLDKTPGMGETISRRDFLDGALLASGAVLLGDSRPAITSAQVAGWIGYTGEGHYKGTAGNTEEIVRNAHAVRDGHYDAKPANVGDTGEVFDCAVVGGGVAERNEFHIVDNCFGGFGSCVEVRKCATFGSDSPTVNPDSPTVLTFLIDLSKRGSPAKQEAHNGRTELLNTPSAVYEKRVREQMTELFGASGFDAKRDIAGIRAFGRIAFSHSDLAGAMDHGTAFMESDRVVNQLLDRVLV